MLTGLGKSLILLGFVFVAVGLALVLVPKIPFLGKLPGDVHLKKENFELYLPFATSVVLSLIVSGILWIIQYFGEK